MLKNLKETYHFGKSFLRFFERLKIILYLYIRWKNNLQGLLV